jgi:small nuclear ribonucleoprotein (snRNP)-like protein|tara:strand:- start:132 stop:488 length:357 start_codon:yes stop_codon:yes gene_type:complete
MAKKQKSFADKASGKGADADSVMVKYVKSVKSEKTGFWRFNEQMIKLRGGENLNTALKRMDETSNLVDIDLSEFESKEKEVEEKVFESKETEALSDSEGQAEVAVKTDKVSDSDGEEE